MAEEVRAMSREDRVPRLVEPDEMVAPLLYVVSREADNVNGCRFDANLWDSSLPPAAPATPPASKCTRSRFDVTASNWVTCLGSTAAPPCLRSS
jgi:hypothetical protein